MDEHCRGCIRYLKSCSGMSKAVCEKHQLRIPRTNADKIRAMTDEELAEWYWWMLKYVQGYTDSRVALLDWLKQEASE